MLLYPKLYLENILSITTEMLEKKQIRGILLDVDNTLIDYEKKTIKGLEEWVKQIKEKGVKLCILSNSNNKDKVQTVALKLNLPYIYFAMKPLKYGYKKAIKVLNLKPEEIAVVGDQIFTDVLGANRMHMFSILVKPLDEKDLLFTLVKRPIENCVIKRYKNSKDKEER